MQITFKSFHIDKRLQRYIIHTEKLFYLGRIFVSKQIIVYYGGWHSGAERGLPQWPDYRQGRSRPRCSRWLPGSFMAKNILSHADGRSPVSKKFKYNPSIIYIAENRNNHFFICIASPACTITINNLQ